MQEIFLGDAIKRRRLELGMTQEQLCEGICEPITISRLENGKQTPSRSRINALLERLGLPSDRYFALVSKKELDLEALKKQIVSLAAQFENAERKDRPAIRAQALARHRELEALAEPGDRLCRQLILYSQTILGKEDGPYPFAEQRELLLQAMHLTHPGFNAESIGGRAYTANELKIIHQLAVVHMQAKEHIEAISILRQLCRYVRERYREMPAVQCHLPTFLFHYARELFAVGQYQKSIDIAEEGCHYCRKFANYTPLANLLSNIAACYHFLGNDEKSREVYHQAYYLMKAIDDLPNLKHLINDVKEYLDLEFPY